MDINHPQFTVLKNPQDINLTGLSQLDSMKHA
jgi:hypothetical protein